ncbi:MAG TPA: AraC family transcriptional regulator [Polyangiaceae bacterium]|nr:AraC family transcriptional regulator [Polyangiaceae bacterium]
MPSNGWPIAVVRQTVDQAAAGKPCARPATHSYATLVFFTGGHSRMEQNGHWELSPGDVLLIPAGQPHRRLEARRAELWGLSFCAPCFAADGAATLLEPFERVRDGASAVVRVPAARHAFFEGLLRELAGVADEPPRSPETRAAVERSLLTLLLHEVDRAAAPPAPGAPPGGGTVAESLRFIERNCLRRLTLNDVAAAVGRSPAHVTTALSRATGRSAVAWIVSGRMAEARRLLLHSNEKVDAIAERVGYADPTHFIRMFRRECGATPAAWRAAQAPAP